MDSDPAAEVPGGVRRPVPTGAVAGVALTAAVVAWTVVTVLFIADAEPSLNLRIAVLSGGVSAAVLLGALVRGRWTAGTVAVPVVLAALWVLADQLWWQTMRPFPSMAVAVTTSEVGVVVIATGSFLGALLVAVAALRAWTGSFSGSPSPAGAPGNRFLRSVALGLATVLSVLLGVVGMVGADRYLFRVNEYSTFSHRPVPMTPGTRTSFDGTRRWSQELSADPDVFPPVVTSDGIAVVVGQDVVMINRATGTQRWQYARSDVSGTAQIAGIDSGRLIAVRWSGGRTDWILVDARSGQRVGRWPRRLRHEDIRPDAPTVLRHDEGRGNISIVSLDRRGQIRWRLPPSPCLSPTARTEGRVVLIEQTAMCGDELGRLTAVDAADGSVVWTRTMPGAVKAVTPTTVFVVVSTERGPDLVAADLRSGRTRWSRLIRMDLDAGAPCDDAAVVAGRSRVLIDCFQQNMFVGRTHRTVLDSASGAPITTTFIPGEYPLPRGLMLFTDDDSLVTADDTGTGCILHVTPLRGKTKPVVVEGGGLDCVHDGRLIRVGGQVLWLSPGLRPTLISLG